MWSKTTQLLAICQVLSFTASAAVVWPNSIDEIEDLMMLQSGYRARQFASIVTPCTNQPVSGFLASAAFVRVAFHDMATHDAAAGTGGLDASVGYEMTQPMTEHNFGPDFLAVVSYLDSFYTTRSSMSDLLALSVYASVRSCSGPQIPIRAGRIDATQGFQDDLPDPADTDSTFTGKFARMGFSPQEMIQLVACGHTLGGLHPAVNSAFDPENPNAAAQANRQLPFDTTPGQFDNKIVTEFLDGTTQNPLVVGPESLNSDKHIFDIDNQVTVGTLSDNDVFMGSCQAVLQKMIEKVPSTVELSDVIQPYDVKPGQINLNVVDSGAAILLSGEIRVRTTSLNVAKVDVIYQGHAGDACTDCTISTTKAGVAQGFDENFAFFSFSKKITSITSFTVVVTTVTGATSTFNNGGSGFPVNDGAFVQGSSSSMGSNGVKVVVAVRSSQNGAPTVTLSTKSAYQFDQLSQISESSTSVTEICSDSKWTYYSATFGTPSQGSNARLDVSVGGVSVDSFRTPNFGSSGSAPVCGSSTTTTSTTASTTSSTTTSTMSTTTTTTTAAEASTTTSSGTSSGSTSSSSASTSLSSTSSGTTTTTTSSATSATTSASSSTSSNAGSTTSIDTSSTTTTKDGQSTTSGQSSSASTMTTSKSASSSSSTLTTTKTTTSEENNRSSTSSSTLSTTKITTSEQNNRSSSTTTTKSGSSLTSTTTGKDASTTTGKSTSTISGKPASTTSGSDAGWTGWGDAPSVQSTSTKTATGSKTSDSAVNGPTSYSEPDNSGQQASAANAAANAAYNSLANVAAPNGGTDGGNKGIDGIDQNISVSSVANTITGTTAVFTNTVVIAMTNNGLKTATVTGAAWSSWAPGLSSATPAATAAAVSGAGAASSWNSWPSATATGNSPSAPPVATYKGSASSTSLNGGLVLGAILGIFAFLL